MLALSKDLFNRDTAQFVATLFDPRGRCNRKGLFVLAVALLALQVLAGIGLSMAGFGVETPFGAVVGFAFLWIGFTAVAKRLHDCNLSAWWFLGAIVIWFVGAITSTLVLTLLVGPEAMQPGRAGYWVAFSMMMLPLLGVMLWLHLKPGDLQSNRFGPAPRANGFAMPLAAAGAAAAADLGGAAMA